jgi:preprotein translocase subunit SecE
MVKKILGKVLNYFKESWQELSKVVWPTRKQVIEITIAVLIISAVVSVFLGFFDFVLNKGLEYLVGLKK